MKLPSCVSFFFGVSCLLNVSISFSKLKILQLCSLERHDQIIQFFQNGGQNIMLAFAKKQTCAKSIVFNKEKYLGNVSKNDIKFRCLCVDLEMSKIVSFVLNVFHFCDKFSTLAKHYPALSNRLQCTRNFLIGESQL